jgi:hypothetical protein
MARRTPMLMLLAAGAMLAFACVGGAQLPARFQQSSAAAPADLATWRRCARCWTSTLRCAWRSRRGSPPGIRRPPAED